MRPDTRFETLADRAEALNTRFGAAAPEAILEFVLGGGAGRVAAVSSFGADSVVLLHMISRIDRDTPVIFLDTEMLFPATLSYQIEVARALALTDIRRITPDREAIFARDTEGDLHRRDPDACCTLRKAEPLRRALAGVDCWITGRKRFQSGGRAALRPFEDDGAGRLKANPLAGWSRDDLRAYMDRHALPRHPLVAEGFPSIGCAPCTSRVAPGEDERAGRWRGQAKDECGIHFVDGKAVRAA